jgi:hypothetical protein
MIAFTRAKINGADGPLSPEIMAELTKKFQLSVFVETGTYLGNTTAAAVQFFKELHTIELSPDLAQKAAQRFANLARVHVHQGDSADRLGGILNQLSGAPLIWLDGHYSEGITSCGRKNTPIIDELKSIDLSGISNAVILIDDLRMFDAREAKAGDPPSLAGYPSIQELHRLVASMQEKYEMFVYGDVALILPGIGGIQVSPLVLAMTISRLFDGANLPIEEVLAAEATIASTRGPERDALRLLARSQSVRMTEGYGMGLHYRYWEALATFGEDLALAEQEFAAVMQLGFTHWRARWYLAKACAALGKTKEMRDHLTQVLLFNPGFAPAAAQLIRQDLAINPAVGDLDKLRACGLWSDGKPLRLHLGCGEELFPGYVNIDYPADKHNVMNVKADYAADITQLDFPPQSVDEIRLHHVFEHFNRVTALAMLIKWQQWLKIGGKIHIETPDLMGSAEILTSNLPWHVKMGAVRHLAGDQAASWAYHVDHWFPERYHRTLSHLGFSDISTKTSRWRHEPYLCNVQAIGIKKHNLSCDQLLNAADQLLWESTVAPAEKETHAVWTRQLRGVLKNVQCGLMSVHKTETESVPSLLTKDLVPPTDPERVIYSPFRIH